MSTTFASQRELLFPRIGPAIPRKPGKRWQWVDFPNAVAASGKPTGLAVSFSPARDARHLVVYFQAGGACWDYLTSSLHVRGYGAVFHLGGFGRREWKGSLVAALHRRMWLFDRDDPTNPFHDAHYAYVPYCTGDLYAGDCVRTVRGPLPFLERELHFRGQANVRAYFARLAATFPNVERIYLIGSSAGGYGASFSWWPARLAWPDTPVDVVSDAGHPIFVPKDKYQRWIGVWGPTLPADGAECADGLLQVLEYAERRFMDPGRYALIASRRDAVLSAFLGMRPGTHARYMDEVRERFFDDRDRYPRTTHARYFIREGYGHTVFPFNHVRTARIGDMGLRDWIRQMVAMDPAWTSWHERDGRVYRQHGSEATGAGR